MIKVKVNEKLHQIDKSIYWLAQESGISYPTLHKIVNGKTSSISYEVLNQLCRVFNCQLGELFEYIPDTEKEAH